MLRTPQSEWKNERQLNNNNNNSQVRKKTVKHSTRKIGKKGNNYTQRNRKAHVKIMSCIAYVDSYYVPLTGLYPVSCYCCCSCSRYFFLIFKKFQFAWLRYTNTLFLFTHNQYILHCHTDSFEHGAHRRE